MHIFFASQELAEADLVRRYIVAELAAGESLSYLLEYIYNNISAEERSAASIIVRPSVKHQIDPEQLRLRLNKATAHDEVDNLYFADEIRDKRHTIFNRYSGVDIRILYSHDYQHRISENLNSPTGEAACPMELSEAEKLIGVIRGAEIDFLVETGKCKLPPLDGQFYKVPSGRYVRSFLRVGSLQTSRAAIDAIFFWLIPSLRQCIGVITDTWSISSIAQNISRRLVDYSGEPGFPCPIEMLGDYHSERDSYGHNAAAIVEHFLKRIPGGARSDGIVLILISATHTGSLVDILRQHLKDRDVRSDQVKYISVFKLAPASEIDCLRDYSNDPDYRPLGADLTDDARANAIVIDGTAYFPTAEMDIENTKTKQALQPYSDFAHRYKDVRFARTHVTDTVSDPSRQRHHAVWLDVAEVVSHDVFIERFIQRLDQLSPLPSVIIIPEHDTARSLANITKKHYAQRSHYLDIIEHNDLRLAADFLAADQDVSSKLESLGISDSILILDDVFITGLRISSYQKNLRDIGFQGTMHYLVAIGRPSNRKHWRAHRSSFLLARGDSSNAQGKSPEKNSFDYVEFLVLPNWSRDQCPWCRESTLQKEFPQYVFGKPEADYDQPAGFDSAIFSTPPQTQQNDFHLRGGSLFGPEGMPQASVFCLVAGLIQTLRTERVDDAPCLGSNHYLMAVILGQSVYSTNYTDSILIASIFKAVKATELVYRNRTTESERTTNIWNFMSNNTNSGLISEFLIAALDNKFPQLVLDDADKVQRFRDAGLLRP
jgi:hypothetical protein